MPPCGLYVFSRLCFPKEPTKNHGAHNKCSLDSAANDPLDRRRWKRHPTSNKTSKMLQIRCHCIHPFRQLKLTIWNQRVRLEEFKNVVVLRTTVPSFPLPELDSVHSADVNPALHRQLAHVQRLFTRGRV